MPNNIKDSDEFPAWCYEDSFTYQYSSNGGPDTPPGTLSWLAMFPQLKANIRADHNMHIPLLKHPKLKHGKAILPLGFASVDTLGRLFHHDPPFYTYSALPLCDKT